MLVTLFAFILFQKMKLIILITLALVAAASAIRSNELPEYVRERLDRYVEFKKTWDAKWNELSDDERSHVEHIFLKRTAHLDNEVKQQNRDRINAMTEEDREKLREYIRTRFPDAPRSNSRSLIDEDLNEEIQSLPDMIRERIRDLIRDQFQRAIPYENESEPHIQPASDYFDEVYPHFPIVPALPFIPVFDMSMAGGYVAEELSEDVILSVDNFLKVREDWKNKWNTMPLEGKDRCERYLLERM